MWEHCQLGESLSGDYPSEYGVSGGNPVTAIVTNAHNYIVVRYQLVGLVNSTKLVYYSNNALQ